MKPIRELTGCEVAFRLTCVPEDTPIEGNCSAIDDDIDRETADWIRAQLDGGNEWAWCLAFVEAEWNGFIGRDSLGGCSYRSEADFRTGPYFEDMKAEALADLNRQVAQCGRSLDTLRV